MRRQLTMNCAQTSVTIGENRQRSALADPMLTECKTSRTRRFGAALANGNKAAILALRYRNSGVIGLLSVKIVE
jgi:hypothetical protein